MPMSVADKMRDALDSMMNEEEFQPQQEVKLNIDALIDCAYY